MDDNLAYTLTLVPHEGQQEFYLNVRLFSAKGKAVERLKLRLSQLNGYVYKNDADLRDLYAWIRQHVEDANGFIRGNYSICMDQNTMYDLYGHKCQTIRVYISRRRGDSFTDVAYVFAEPLNGSLSRIILKKRGGKSTI